MTAGLKPYPAYRQTELPWLTHVPSHWGLVPNRGLIRRRKVLVGDRHTEYRLLSLTKQGVIVRDISTGKGKFSSDMGTSQEVRDGDLVFCLFDVPETPRTVGLSRHAGMITGAYTVFELLARGNSEYFELFYQAMDDRKLLSPLYSGLRNTIPAARFLGTKSPLPPLEDQEAIVRFLNWANARIERAIRTKRKVIALLNEQKQAIIHHAVTRGISASVALKPSGIEWLGDVPHHWDVALVKHVADVRFSGVDKHSHDHEIPVRLCNYTDVYKNDQITDDMDLLRATATAGEIARLTLKAGDVIITKDSETPDDIAVPAWVPEELPGVVCAYHLGLLRPDPGRIEGEFLFRAIGSARISEQFHVLATGVTRFALSKHDVKNAVVALPPVEEQKAICKWIDDECKPLEDAILLAEEEINLVQEYRISLVADVVTGKLDVRMAATKLADEIPVDTTSGEDLSNDSESVDQEAIE